MDKETLNLLYAKVKCIHALTAALEFRQIEPEVFNEARKTFQEYGLMESVKAVNQLQNFVIDLRQYNSLEEIPENEETRLMLTLQPMKALNGYTSQGIADRVPKEGLALTMPDIEPIEVKLVQIEKTAARWIRFCLVQLDFSLAILPPSRVFGYVLPEDEKQLVKKKIFSALKIARSENANIVCLPELSFAPEWIDQVKTECKDMIVICGSYYKDRFNTCPILISGTEYHIRKINPSPDIEEEIEPGRGMKRGNEILIFQTRFGKFTTLICLDYMKEVHHIIYNQDKEKSNIDFIINPSCNRDVINYQERANQDCQVENFPYIIQVNVLVKSGKKCGGTCIIGMEHDSAISRYESEGYRPTNDAIRYKLLQAEGETIIIADLDIAKKAVPVPPTGLKMKNVNCYIFRNELWQRSKDL